MLTRAQIQRLAQHHRVGLQVQERDYVQHLLLFLLYGRSQALIFIRRHGVAPCLSRQPLLRRPGL